MGTELLWFVSGAAGCCCCCCALPLAFMATVLIVSAAFD